MNESSSAEADPPSTSWRPARAKSPGGLLNGKEPFTEDPMARSIRQPAADVKISAGLGSSTTTTAARSAGASETVVLMLRGDESLEFADPASWAFLGYDSEADLRADWRKVRPLLSPALGRPGQATKTAATTDPRRRWSTVAHYLPDVDRYLLVLTRDAVPSMDRVHALQLRNLAALRQSMDHRFRGALNALALNVELLRGELAGEGAGGPESRTRSNGYVSRLAQAISRLPAVLEEVLRAIEPVTDSREAVDFNELLEELRTLLAAEARLKRVKFTVQPASSPVDVRVSRGILRQAVLSLCLEILGRTHDGDAVEIVLAVRDGYATWIVTHTCRQLPGDLPEEPMSYVDDVRSRIPDRTLILALAAELGGSVHERAVESGTSMIEIQFPIGREV